MFSFRSFGGICETASCPVRELTSARDVQSTSWNIHELSSYRAEAQVVLGGIVKRLLIAYFIGKISEKKYQNAFT